MEWILVESFKSFYVQQHLIWVFTVYTCNKAVLMEMSSNQAENMLRICFVIISWIRNNELVYHHSKFPKNLKCNI
jgi:hypothetical protein